MTLQKYQEKRSFDRTPEPSQTKTVQTNSFPVFCIQKHDASHLHYDFRLEHKGVLLSWAIPKGPSTNPKDKRLAIQVEDHPLQYRHFEGIIPPGNYGAGRVMIWDEGTYTLQNEETKEEIEKNIEIGLKKGHLNFILLGEKLRGAFSLIKIKSEKDNQWLFIKVKESDAKKFSSDSDLDKWDYSVRSKRSLDQIGKGIPGKKKVKEKKMPAFIKPMLATLVETSFDSADWLFETKWDGYRALAYIDKKKVTLYSRNENNFTKIFSPLVQELSQLNVQAILDGEIVILEKSGKSNFQLMQNYQRTQQGALYYYVFDLLFLNGTDMRQLPLIERKELLKNLLNENALEKIRYSDHVIEKGLFFLEKAKEHHLEGIIAKRLQSTYSSRRSKEWLKIKINKRQEAVIGGFTRPKGSRKGFGALILGIYNNKKLIPIGLVGTGFTAKSISEIYQKMQPLVQTNSSFSKQIKTDTPATWIDPQLVCEVSFSEWTKEGMMRHPTFQGLRQDKPAKEVRREREKNTLQTLKPISTETSTMLSNPEKIFWPKEKYTKQNLMDYYLEISPYLLPFLKNRPIMLRRFPNGIGAESFIQKDISSLHLPAGIDTAPIEHEGKIINYLLIQNEISLEYAINLGAIELHPFHSQIGQLGMPDYFVLDLDPEAVPFNKVIEAAQVIHQLFEEMKIPHYCKTSGGRGLHIYIPLHAQYTALQVAQFGQLLANLVQQELPKITSLERSPKKRQKKIYLDVLQNRPMQTMVAPYSLRGRSGATASAPLNWNELHKSLSPQDFTIKTMPERLKKIGDIFTPILEKGFDLKKWVKNQDE